MFRILKKEIKKVSLERNYLKKGEKSRLGGAGEGGIYRDKATGKDYLLKRIASPGVSLENKLKSNWRAWDEILAAKFLVAAGVLVPNMFAVEDASGLIYVASSMLPGVKNCTKNVFEKLPASSREAVFASQLMHCWLGNRDLVNVSGENFVVDNDNRVFNVDLGAALFSGFRRIIQGQDDVNFNADSIHTCLLDGNNNNFGMLVDRNNRQIPALNIDKINAFFSEYLSSPDNERKYQLQGALIIEGFRDEDIETLVNSSGHTDEDKLLRIEVLKARRQAILEFIENKYSAHALEEERLSLRLQRIFHKHGIYNQFVNVGGSDAIVSYRAQYTNAVKPNITINADGTVSIQLKDASVMAKAIPVLQRFSGAGITVSGMPPMIMVTMPLADFKAEINRELIENSLQIFFSSFGYYSHIKDDFHRFVYKGDGHSGFRPTVSNQNNTLMITLPADANSLQILKAIANEFNIDSTYAAIKNNTLLMNGITLEDLASCLMQNTGVRKVAIISENSDGKILAGKLDVTKKGVSGFATAGGGCEHPYNPLLAAREEGADEFGYSIDTHVSLIPIGSTLPNKTKNIFLVPPEGTSNEADRAIDYQEFQDGSIKYYSFSEFRAAFKTNKIVFDRSSVDLYLRYYQREIQKIMTQLGIENVLVHIAKNSHSIGKIYLKPSIENYNYLWGSTRRLNKNCLQLMRKLLGKQYGSLVIKESNHSGEQNSKKIISRECLEINESINPARFYDILVKHSLESVLHSDKPVHAREHESQWVSARSTLTAKIDNYLYWRAKQAIALLTIY